jgi:hypothetical protein
MIELYRVGHRPINLRALSTPRPARGLVHLASLDMPLLFHNDEGAPMITAKIRCVSKVKVGEGDDEQSNLRFSADYADDRNKAWSKYTPALDLTMIVKGSVADQFDTAKAFTLTFEPAED